MESPDDEDDLKLAKQSAGLLSDLEAALPKVLWKASKSSSDVPRVHTQVRRRDLNYIIGHIEPFQGEPQLLDARLKYILPPLVDAYVAYLKLDASREPTDHLDLQSAICIILYTLCKVRGYKVIVGFLNNEPRYLEPVLKKLEHVLDSEQEGKRPWQVPYVLLLWLSHLLLTPFDLASISNTPVSGNGQLPLRLAESLPSIVVRILKVVWKCLPMSTKAQDGAAMLLVRLVIRPDMQRLKLADIVTSECLNSLEDPGSEAPVTIYERLGPLRFLSGVAASPELSHLVPNIYRLCARLFDDDSSPVTSNAVAKKILVKTLRNVAILSLRIGDAVGPLASFLQTTGVVEDVIDYLLRSLGDRDTPVRHAAAKALSRIILEIEPEMGHEVVQAILDTFKEDMPRQSEAMDFRTVNALKWHGLTLALAHTIFKRSASPDQLPDIVNALTSALQFEQRTATGGSIGTNARDAANFGIWSLSRRYTTKELLSVNTEKIKGSIVPDKTHSVIQIVAINLILSACLDPVGNIRRGSSAALQELIGRHPNEVHEGISLVQVVDYQAVGLRRRAMVDVAFLAAELQDIYWYALLKALIGWRGLGSPDVPSREAAASALSRFSTSPFHSSGAVLKNVTIRLLRTPSSDVEDLHGIVLSLAKLLDRPRTSNGSGAIINGQHKLGEDIDLWNTVTPLLVSMKKFSPRLLRAELPAATAQLLSALCRAKVASSAEQNMSATVPFEALDSLTDQLLTRHEDTIQQHIPTLAHSLLTLKQNTGTPLGCIGAQHLTKQVAAESSKSTFNGACRAIALGSLAPLYHNGLSGENTASVINTLAFLTEAMNVEWRVIGVKALQLAIDGVRGGESTDHSIVEIMVSAIHRGLNDYTIDERGDIGSLVRLQGISCASTLLVSTAVTTSPQSLQILHADIYRLSLEKLDRVRLEAAKCRRKCLEDPIPSADVAIVSSESYFSQNLRALSIGAPLLKRRALLEGCISCAGMGAEPLLQASRQALAALLIHTTIEHLSGLMGLFSDILKYILLENTNSHPALELLGFFLDMQIPQRLAGTDFKWRNLLSTVQKAHHKSNDIPKILGALHAYRGLADVPSIRDEVLKKLVSMLKTNPYPRIRLSVAEVLYAVTADPVLKDRDWMRPPSQNLDVIEQLRKRYVGS